MRGEKKKKGSEPRDKRKERREEYDEKWRELHRKAHISITVINETGSDRHYFCLRQNRTGRPKITQLVEGRTGKAQGPYGCNAGTFKTREEQRARGDK